MPFNAKPAHSSTQMLFRSGKHKSWKLKTPLDAPPGPIPQQGYLLLTQPLPPVGSVLSSKQTTRIILLLRKQNSREVPLPANGGDPLEYRSKSGALTSRPQCFVIDDTQLSCCCCTAFSPSVNVLKAPKELSPSHTPHC